MKILAVVLLGVLALSLGTTAVPMAHEQIEEQSQAEEVLKEILSTLQSEKTDQVSHTVEEESSDPEPSFLSREETSERVAQRTEETQEKDARKQNAEKSHRRAFLQRALKIGLMQMSRNANRQAQQQQQQQGHRGSMQRGRRSAATKPMQKRSSGAQVQGPSHNKKATKSGVSAKTQLSVPDLKNFLPYFKSDINRWITKNPYYLRAHYDQYDYDWYTPDYYSYDYWSPYFDYYYDYYDGYLPYYYYDYDDCDDDYYTYWPDSYYDYDPYSYYSYDDYCSLCYYGYYGYYGKAGKTQNKAKAMTAAAGEKMRARARANSVGHRRTDQSKQTSSQVAA